MTHTCPLLFAQSLPSGNDGTEWSVLYSLSRNFSARGYMHCSGVAIQTLEHPCLTLSPVEGVAQNDQKDTWAADAQCIHGTEKGKGSKGARKRRKEDWYVAIQKEWAAQHSAVDLLMAWKLHPWRRQLLLREIKRVCVEITTRSNFWIWMSIWPMVSNMQWNRAFCSNTHFSRFLITVAGSLEAALFASVHSFLVSPWKACLRFQKTSETSLAMKEILLFFHPCVFLLLSACLLGEWFLQPVWMNSTVSCLTYLWTSRYWFSKYIQSSWYRTHGQTSRQFLCFVVWEAYQELRERNSGMHTWGIEPKHSSCGCEPGKDSERSQRELLS